MMAKLARRAVATVISGVTNGLPSRSPPTQLPRRIGAAQRTVSLCASNSSSKARTSASRARGARVDQPRLEVPEHGAHLVAHRRPVLAHLGRGPQQLHLAVELLLQRVPFGRRRPLAREQQVGHPRLEPEERATRGLRGMRGEHRTHVEPPHRLRHLVRRVPRSAQALHRPLRRGRLRLLRLGRAVRSRASHPMHLLRGVDQQEEEGEGARRHRAEVERELRDLVEQGVERRGIGLAVAARATGGTESFHGLECLFPLLRPDHAAQCRGEPPDVVVQGHVLAAHAWPGQRRRRLGDPRMGGGWRGRTWRRSHPSNILPDEPSGNPPRVRLHSRAVCTDGSPLTRPADRLARSGAPCGRDVSRRPSGRTRRRRGARAGDLRLVRLGRPLVAQLQAPLPELRRDREELRRSLAAPAHGGVCSRPSLRASRT